jgi:hypothetical protein
VSLVVGRLEYDVTVEWGLFGLVDAEHAPPGLPGWGGLGSPMTMLIGVNAAAFRSGAVDQTVVVSLQTWDGDPGPVADGVWEEVWDGELDLTSGRVRAVSVTAFTTDEDLLVGPPGRYHLRACSRGRAEAARVFAAGDLPDGVERWQLDFWVDAPEPRLSN